MFNRIKLNGIFYFIVIFVAPVVALFLRKIPQFDKVWFLQYIDEASLLIAGPIVVDGFSFLMRRKNGFFLILFFLLYIGSSVISGIVNHVSLSQMSFQFVLESKYLIIICLLFGVKSYNHINDILSKYIILTKLLLSFSLPLVLFQFLDPILYHKVFSSGADRGLFILPNGMILERGAGVFWFTGQLAMFSGASCILFLFVYLEEKKSWDLIWLLVASILLLLTFSVGEILGTLIGILVTVLFFDKKNNKNFWIGFFCIAVPLFFFFSFPLLLDVYRRAGISDIVLSESTRTVFYYKSLIISRWFFPLGAGLGTFGGQASVLYGSNIYCNLDFDSYWWFRAGVQMTDTFWPHILGESGWIGLIFFLLSLFFLFKILLTNIKIFSCLNSFNRFDYTIAKASAAIFVLFFVNSFASPVYYSSVEFIQCVLFICFAYFSSRFYFIAHSREVFGNSA